MKILIVDDSRAMQAIVRRAVMETGIDPLEIQTASSGHDALNQVQSFKPDVVLTDWHMPGMTGLQMVQTMRQMGLRDTYVGFVTTETQNDRVQEALNNGANFVLNKPFKDEELREKLGAIANKISSKPIIFKPITLEGLTAVVRETLKEVPFRLVEKELTSSDLSKENLLALYRSETTKALTAVAVLDLPAMTMMGAGALGMQPADVKPLIETESPTEDIQIQAADFLGRVASAMRAEKPGELTMLKQSLVSKDFAKLQELLRHNRGQAYFKFDIPGYGSGRMGFLLV
ncbi:MAG: response regulator [Betaproteobacteria bacterium]|nr:response regulator [Betaproteobacteria bacterium]